MHSSWQGASLRGVEGLPVRVEVQLARGLPALSLVGLAGAATRESRERVYGALRESGFELPAGRVTVNLSPAEEPKEGSAFDLPMALGLLEVTGQLRPRQGRDWWWLGELGLDGSLLPLRGALPLGLSALAGGAAGLVLPVGNLAEASYLDGLPLLPLATLREAVDWIAGSSPVQPRRVQPPAAQPAGARAGTPLLLPGGPRLRRALAAAAVGGHNLLLLGAPGNGKSTLARGLAELLPPLDRAERREVMALRSAAGLAVDGSRRRPLRAPHHSLSLAGLLGRQGPGARPGELSLAHRGLLFLDELPEFHRDVLEALREPMEEGSLVVSRGAGSLRWPARFQLAAAMNPCPCGLSLRGREHCRCTPGQVQRYRARLSGPLLDRIDLILELPAWRPGDASDLLSPEAAARLRRQILRARRRLRQGRQAALAPGERDWLDRRLSEAGASFRQRLRLAALAGTLAALDGRPQPGRSELVEALDLGLRWRLALRAMPGS
jgi:magnesium chelatase family protein